MPAAVSPARHRLPAYIETLIARGEHKLAREQVDLVRHDAERFAVYLDALASLVAVRFVGKKRAVVAARTSWMAYLEVARRSLPTVAPRELLERLVSGALRNTTDCPFSGRGVPENGHPRGS